MMQIVERSSEIFKNVYYLLVTVNKTNILHLQ